MDVDVCGYAWICVDMCGYVWICVDGCGYLWMDVDICGWTPEVWPGYAPYGDYVATSWKNDIFLPK